MILLILFILFTYWIVHDSTCNHNYDRDETFNPINNKTLITIECSKCDDKHQWEEKINET